MNACPWNLHLYKLGEKKKEKEENIENLINVKEVNCVIKKKSYKNVKTYPNIFYFNIFS